MFIVTLELIVCNVEIYLGQCIPIEKIENLLLSNTGVCDTC